MERAAARMKRILCVAVGVLAFALPLGAQDSSAPLRLVQTIPLSVDGRMDHLAIDVKGMRLFVAALGNNTVEVIDLRAGKVINSLTEPKKPQGVWYVPSLKKLFVASGNDGMVRVYNGETMALIASIKLDLGPDLLGYNSRTKVVYVGYGGEDAKNDYGNVGIIDARKNKHAGDIKTVAHPGGILVDDSGRRLYVTIPATSEVVVIDPKSNQIIKSWKVTEAQRTVSLALDQANGRLFVGARTPGRVMVYDTKSFNKVAEFPTVGLLDGMFFDSTRKRLYVSGGEGFVDVVQLQAGDRYEPLTKTPTRPMARTSLFVPELNRYYVALPRKDTESAEIRVYEPQ